MSARPLLANEYYDRAFETRACKILPGEFCATGEDILLVTVLGSCVAACIRDRRSGIGGMNHFMLPDAGDPSEPLAASARYGVHAMEMLLNDLSKLGADRRALEAKVFGGGAVVQGMTASRVGERNAAFVLEFLGREGIPVVSRDLLGEEARRVHYFPRTGRALVKKLQNLRNDTIAQRETDYRRRLATADVGGAVELF